MIWYFIESLSDQEKKDIIGAFQRAEYKWVWLSMIPAVLSHLSRAYRWKFTLQPLGYKPDLLNSFFAVMAGYLINLAVPRLGEISRCGLSSRYDKIPFEKLLGTVIAERVADLAVYAIIMTTVLFVQYQNIQDFLNNLLSNSKFELSGGMVIAILGFLFLSGVAGIYLVYRVQWENKLFSKIQQVLRNVISSAASIFKMKNKGAFLFHTVFIWVMYFFMFYLCFFAVPETSGISFGGALTAFILGGLTIIFTNGGLGAYPLAVQAVLVLYDIDKVSGGALGWIIWTAQTVMIILLGAGSLLLIPVYNRRKNRLANAA